MAALLLAAPPLRAADPFYERLVRDGNRELARGDHAAAERDLQIAAFGLLDEPVRLAEALVPLALAQAALDDAEGFEDTFARVIEVEDRFGAYGKAEIPADQRSAFEKQVVARVPTATLERSAAFRPLARRQHQAEIQRLPKRERRQRLEERVAAEPDQSRWLVLLGRLEMEDRNRDRAVELATRALTLSPTDQDALCLRGLALVESGNCAQALTDLDACDESRTNPAVARTVLECLAGMAHWDEASEHLDGLAPEVRDDKSLEKVKRRIERQAGATAVAVAPEAAPTKGEKQSAPAGQGDAPAPPAGTPPAPPPASDPQRPAPPAPAITADDLDTMTQARALLTRAKTTSDLDEAGRLARDVADRNPESAEAQYLAGEIAYRTSRWQDAAQYFKRGGDPGAKRAELSFYMAVAFFETGELEAARAALTRALPGLKRTPFVESYVTRILASPVAP